MDNHVKGLKSIGLNNTQAKVYLKLLHEGQSTITDIANKTGIKRPTVHENIMSLIKIGIVVQVFERGKKYYMCDTPDKLIELINQKQNVIQTLLPDFFSMYSQSAQKATVQFFDGLKGKLKIHELALKYHRDYKTYYIGSVVNSLYDVLSERDVLDYVEKRVKLGIWNYVISTDDISQMSHIYNEKRNKECLREMKIIPSLKALFVNLFVFGEYVCISSSAKDDYVIIVHSNEFAETVKNIFRVLWEIKE